jgi:O-antigen ligase
MSPWNRVRDLSATIGWLLLLLPIVVVLLSVVVSPATNWAVRGALAGFCMLAILRPADAMLITTALVGFGIILSHLAGVPSLRATEAMAVVSIGGCCIRALPPDSRFRRALTESLPMPVVLFALAAVASTVVWLRVSQVQTGYPSAFLQGLFHFLSREYFVRGGDLLVVSTAAILEGLALYVAAAALCRLDATFFERALRMLAIGGAALATMSVVRLAEIVLRNPNVIEALRATYAGLRISPQIPDYIAAGSYFALCWLAAIGIALASSGQRLIWVAVSVPLLAGLYLTGSRSVIFAAVGGLLVLLFTAVRRSAAAVRGVVIFAIVAVVVMVVTFQWMIGHDVAGETAKLSLTVRVELIKTGWRVFATRPLFGVGIDRFFLLAGPLASPLLESLWHGRKNPHNDFLRVGAELGLVGLGLFVWFLASAGKRIWLALRTKQDACLAGLVGGLTAFLITSMVSSPLMLREVSFAFWIGLGLAVGGSARPGAAEAAAPGPSAASTRAAGWHWPVTLLIGGMLLASIPFRAGQELAAIDLTRVSYGLFDGGTEPDGTVFRWSGPTARIFVDGRAKLVEIPFRSALPSGALQEVEVLVDGRLANRISVGPEWRQLRTVLPANSHSRTRRIDLVVSPSWVPAEVIHDSQDRRVLGVKVGTISVVMSSSPDR